MTYRWKRAHDWLEEMGTELMLKQLVYYFISEDDIQELFETGMRSDGYFDRLVRCQFCDDKLPEEDLVECPRCKEKQCPCCCDTHLDRCNECEYFLDDLYETDPDEFEKQMKLEGYRLEELRHV